MAWHLAPALVVLRDQVNTRWPGRDRSADGTIGDAAHAGRASDHNPDSDGSVNAWDVTASGIDVAALIAAVIADPRTAYVIHAGRIWTPGSGWRPYTGSSPHTHHVHVSVVHEHRETDASPWALGEEYDMAQLDTIQAQGEAILALLRVPGLGGAGYPEATHKALGAALPLVRETRDRVRGDDPHADVLQLLGARVAATEAALAALAITQGADPTAITEAAEEGARRALAGLTLVTKEN